MKSILITGSDSYIGTSFENYVKKRNPDYVIDTADVRDDSWQQTDFSKYDAVFHVAAIVHKKQKPDMEQLYMKVNCDLPLKIASMAKEQGTGQFVFMSSMSVYGITTGVISDKTKPGPKTFYGSSKLKAEKGLNKLQSEDFNVAVLRPPMVYGSGCRGNYASLIDFAEKSPIFPDFSNKRSMVHIDNLCASVESIIKENKKGLFFPQDPEYVCTSDMVADIAASLGRKMHRTRVFNPAIKLLMPHAGVLKKVFGDLIYEKNLPVK